LLCFLVSNIGKETLGGGEEKLDDLFTNKEGDEATNFVSEGLGGQELDVRPSDGGVITSKKGEVATQGYEYEDVEILKIFEEGRPTTELLAVEPITEEAFTETTAAESTVPAEIALEECPVARWIPL